MEERRETPLIDFLIAVAHDPEKLRAFAADPEAFITAYPDYPLTAEQTRVLRSGTFRDIHAAILEEDPEAATGIWITVDRPINRPINPPPPRSE
jgi:hypothetical protein